MDTTQLLKTFSSMQATGLLIGGLKYDDRSFFDAEILMHCQKIEALFGKVQGERLGSLFTEESRYSLEGLVQDLRPSSALNCDAYLQDSSGALINANIRIALPNEPFQIAEKYNPVVISIFDKRCAVYEKRIDEITAANALIEGRLALYEQSVSGFHHDVRTPLTVIMSSAELMGDNLKSDSRDSRLCSAIRGESERILNLSDILKEAVHPQTNIEKIDICGLASVLFDRYSWQFSEKNLKTNIYVNGNLYNGEKIYGLMNASDLDGAVSNVLLNAIRHSYNSGGINISIISPSNNADYVYMDIINHGVPIPETDKDRIFNNFSTSGGVGVGLMKSRYNLNKNDGTLVLLKSDPGSTVFRLGIPYAPEMHQK